MQAMDNYRMIMQASSTPVLDEDRIVSLQHHYISFNLDEKMRADFEQFEIDLPHMHTTNEPGRLLVYTECGFLNAVGDMSQTSPRAIKLAIKLAVSCESTFKLHPTELSFLHVCSKYGLYLNKHLIKK